MDLKVSTKKEVKAVFYNGMQKLFNKFPPEQIKIVTTETVQKLKPVPNRIQTRLSADYQPQTKKI